MTFDEWYKEQIRNGSITQPSRSLRKRLAHYWFRVEASGEQPTTESMIRAMSLDATDGLSAAAKGLQLVGQAAAEAGIAMRRMVGLTGHGSREAESLLK